MGLHNREAHDAVHECWKLAGFVGVEPGNLTLGELYWMAKGKAEILGGTSASSKRDTVMAYDPAMLASW